MTTAATTTWIDVPEGHGFGVDTLPLGSFRIGTGPARVGVAIGDHVLDVGAALAEVGSALSPLTAAGNLDAILAAGPETWRALRDLLRDLVTDPSHREQVEPHLMPAEQVTMLLPFTVADYVDFYSSEQHATNIGRMFRPDEDPLPPNWKHLPIGYHGRAGTVMVSGSDVVRPNGQRREPDGTVTLGPSRRLDIEAELGFVVGTPSVGGTAVSRTAFADHVFGVCLVNDWSARDIQAWEYKPLGPFLGKSFATSIGAWVVPLAALEQARVEPPPRDPTPLPYLDDAGERWGLDITYEVRINGTLLSRPPARDLYWTGAQQLAHTTVNGASVRTGDLYASGTISGADRDTWGSLIELTWGGDDPVTLDDGTTRTFLEDGDEVVISATAPGPAGTTVSLGDVRGVIAPAREI